MARLEFVVIIEPKAQKRARSRAVTMHGKTVAMTYKDSKQRQAERSLEALLYEHRPQAPFTGPIALGVKAYLPIPKSKPKRWKAEAEAGIVRPTGKPDLSNIIKNFEDVANGVFWNDDVQIVEYLPGTGKYYGTIPRWEIVIEEL